MLIQLTHKREYNNIDKLFTYILFINSTKMRKTLLILITFIATLTMKAQEPPLWMRYSAISPNGKEIAFSYKGDIFKVPVEGGRAIQLTTHAAHDTRPVWSPDGTQIAFSSNRENSFDIYLMSAQGGAPKRLTTHTSDAHPITFRNNESILYTSVIKHDAMHGEFPSARFPQVYEVNTAGNRPTLFSSLTMEDISIDPTGTKLLYHDKKGYEDPWRKRHTSSITRDIWLHELEENKTYKQLTTFKGENRTPRWSADGESFYYLSEQDGSFNVYKRGLDDAEATKLTNFKDNPVRFLSVSNNGTLCFTFKGEIYTMQEQGEPQKVSIQILKDNQENKLKHINFTSGAKEMAVSPDGKEIAFVVRGDVFVTSVEYGTTRRITNTPEQERNVSYSPDGRSILYASERNGLWNLYQTSLVKKDEKSFIYASKFKEEQLTDSKVASFQPLYSPDGKEIAYLHNRTEIRVLNLSSKKTRTVLDGKYNYSYSDGDQWYRWSPDSKWIIAKYISVGGWNNTDIALINADGSGQITNLTESGYSDSNPRFALDGKAMIWFSDRAGYRSHGSWGAHKDAYIMFFDSQEYDKFRMSKEELALLKEQEKKEKEEDDENKKDDKKDKESKKKDVKPLEFDLENRRDRIIRLTPNSSSVVDAMLNKDGDKLYYLTRFEKDYDLWEYDLKKRSSKILSKATGAGVLHTDKEGKNILMLSKGQLKKIDMAKGSVKPIKIAAQFEYEPEEERTYIFNHAWKQVLDKFYVKDLHGIDWEGYKETYQRYLPHINNNFDFTEMLSEMLGELNGSHTGARYVAPKAAMPTATLGAFYDEAYSKDGLKIKEVINQGPLTAANINLKAGGIIIKIDNQTIEKGKDYYHLLAGKAGKKVLLTYKESENGAEKEEWVKPISLEAESNLLYKRWVEQRRVMTDSLSNGKIGYVHVRGMDSNSFREVYSDVLGRYRNREAIIIDTRHNGGGWLHDDLVTLLSGKEYQRFEPRGQYIGSDPFNKWLKPSAVLVCEDNYSNAHGFPWLYKELGIGKLIGTSVPGTMTAVWWESQIDPSIVFGIPQVAVKDMRGNYLENQDLEPDIEVYNTPASIIEGKDLQLEKAVEELLKGK